MQTKFDNILEFTKIRDRCIFCGQKLVAILTSFYRLSNLNVKIKDKIIKFKLNETTASYHIEANCSINTEDNEISFTPIKNSESTYVDQSIAKIAFESISPHIELYCQNKKCKYEYYLSSMPFTFSSDSQKIYPIRLFPVKICAEAFCTKTFFIENDWTKEALSIYPLDNENAKPIKSQMIDFSLSSPEQILNRISMLITFN